MHASCPQGIAGKLARIEHDTAPSTRPPLEKRWFKARNDWTGLSVRDQVTVPCGSKPGANSMPSIRSRVPFYEFKRHDANPPLCWQPSTKWQIHGAMEH